VIFTGLFTYHIFLRPVPLDIMASVADATYPDGTIIAGVKWRSEFTKLTIEIHNSSSGMVYEDLDLVLKPDQPVAAIAQLSSIIDVSFDTKHALRVDPAFVEGATGNKKAIPLVLVATDAGYRIHCNRLPSRVPLTIIVAVADMIWNPSPSKPREDFGVFEKNYVLRIKMSDASSYWYGYPDAKIYTPRPLPRNLKIEGSYMAGHIQRTVTKDIAIINPVEQVQQEIKQRSGGEPTKKK
jgi:hypothetical protein